MIIIIIIIIIINIINDIYYYYFLYFIGQSIMFYTSVNGCYLLQNILYSFVDTQVGGNNLKVKDSR